MSGQKRPAGSELDGGPPSKKRGVTAKTVDKWIAENDKVLNTTTWLRYDKLDREYVASLKCSMCIRFQDKLRGTRNYNPAYITGSKNLRASAFKDHAKSDMHQRAMVLFKKSQSSDVTEYAPIAKALSTLDASSEQRLKRKFEIAYMLCKQNLPFTKMAPICELEERHGVDLGSGYKNDQACATFVGYIAQEQRELLASALGKVRFFTIQADGSTDSANMEEELFLVLYFDPHATDGKIHVQDKFLTVRQPTSANAAGLFECFTRALGHMGITDWESKLIGFGCDGTSVNIGARGLRGYVEESVPWVVFFWCLAHRLELSLKDALKGTLFSTIDDMLLRVYYLYHKSPKKCRELDEVVASLKLCLEQSEMPHTRTKGNRPLRACGTRFVSHKVAAMNRFIDRYGAFLGHLTSLTEDATVLPADKQKMKGYILKWRDSKMVLGCAMFHDLLKPSAILCKVLQDDEICVVDAIEAVLKTSKAVEKLKTTDFDELPTVKKVLLRIQHTADDGTTYQGAQLVKFEEGIAYLKSHKNGLMESVLTCLKDRVKVQHPDLLTDTLTLLASQGWEKSDDADFADVALNALSTRFADPLEKAGVDVTLIKEEWEDMMQYAKRYLNLVQEDYQTIWWKLFNAADSKKWTNILALIELLFCFPMANGRVERIFSALKLIKSDRRSSLSEDHLDDLVRIAVDAPPLSQWDASGAIQLWWKDKQRRQVGDTRAPPKRTPISESEATASEPYEFSLEDWESFIA